VGRRGRAGQPVRDSGTVATFAFVFDAVILFGLARLADLIRAVHAARDELAEAAVTAERVRAADSLRAAVGGRRAEAAGRSAAALQAIAGHPSLAREQIAETEVTARQALAEVREVATRYRNAPWPEAARATPGEPLAPRLAQAVLVVVLSGLALLYVLFVAENVHGVPGGYSLPVVALTIADAVALVILQLRHSWPSRGAGTYSTGRPRGWPVTLFLQAILTYALFPWTGWHPLIMLGFLAGSALLLVPAPPGWIAFAAVIASLPVLWAVKPVAGLSTVEWLGVIMFLTLDSAALGLLVYGLTRLAQLAVQLEDLRGELARKAVAGERLRLARDTHDLLGLGLSAIAMKADLIGKLIGPDDARAGEEIAELARICATARADVRLVAGEARDLPLDVELAAARDILASAGIDVRMCVSADPSREAAAVLVPVVREAVTNILKHSSASYCVLEMTADAGLLHLLISNDGSDDNGLHNLATRLEAVGGHQTASVARASFGSMTRSPAATFRNTSISWSEGASLTMNPATCASRAARSCPGRPSTVRITTRHAGSRSCSCDAAVTPSSPGRSMSSTARSGRSASAAGTMSVPTATWATTLMSSSRFSTETSVSRSIRMSSATRTRIITPPTVRTTALSPGRRDRPTRYSPTRPRASPAPSPSSRRPAGCRSRRAARP
jgi:two-component system sensor histidine kinase DesK